MRTLLNLTALLLLSLLAFVAANAGPAALNLDTQGVALQGYDPVAFFTDGKPVLGNAAFSSQRDGATYRFASAEHRATFDQEPARYEPQFGGYCAYGVAKGHLSPVKVEAFQIVDGHLIMQYNPEVRDLFNQDKAANLKEALEKWPEVAAEGE